MTTRRLEPGPWRMPGEFEPHEVCLLAWPTRSDLWGAHLEPARREYAGVVEAILAFEPVLVVADRAGAAGARTALPSGAEIVEIPIDDSWVRDSGPIVTVEAAGTRSGADFAFNSWGGKYAPWDRDAASAAVILERLGIPRRASSMVLEGGAITVDGQGTLITTEQCLLHPNRNPGMTREQIEDELARMLGIATVVWLPHGQFEDRDTDGHVDGVAAFARPGVVVAQTCEDRANPNHSRLLENLDVLRSAVDARGRAFEVVELPVMTYPDFDGEPMASCYVNFYVANGGVVVPVTGDAGADGEALAVIRAAFPEREVVGVAGQVIAFGGGGPHCITQQVPAVSTAGVTS